MSITLLRKLTKKSLIGFGNSTQRNSTVQQMLNQHKYERLRSMYYLLSAITFTDEILDEIGIYEQYRIHKPGKMTSEHYDNLKNTIFNHNEAKPSNSKARPSNHSKARLISENANRLRRLKTKEFKLESKIFNRERNRKHI